MLKVLQTIDASISDHISLGCLQSDFLLKPRYQSIAVFKANYGIESTI